MRRWSDTRTWVRSTSVVLVLSVFAACGGESGNGSESTTSEAPSTTNESNGTTTTMGETGGEWDQVVAEAQEQGQVTLYISPPGLHEPLIEAFNEQYPDIEVEALRAPGGELATRIEQEREAGVEGADVFWNADPTYCTNWASEGDLIAPAGPNSEIWRESDYFMQDAWIMPYNLVYVLAWNTDLVDEPLTSYEDLLRPELQGLIGSSDIESVTAFWYWLYQEYGEEFLRDLAEQDLNFFPSGVPKAEALSVGELSADMSNVAPTLSARISAGAAIEYVIPEKAMGLENCLAILGWGNRHAAAQVFVDFLLSEEAHQIIHSIGEGGGASPVYEIDGTVNSDDLAATLNPENFPAAELDEFRPVWHEIFG